jgi:hypothetical protein
MLYLVLNVLIVLQGCIAKTKELVIYSHSKKINKGLIPSAEVLDFTKDIDELSSLIEVVHNINFSKVVNELGSVIKQVSVDLASVEQLLADFKNI